MLALWTHINVLNWVKWQTIWHLATLTSRNKLLFTISKFQSIYITELPLFQSVKLLILISTKFQVKNHCIENVYGRLPVIPCYTMIEVRKLYGHSKTYKMSYSFYKKMFKFRLNKFDIVQNFLKLDFQKCNISISFSENILLCE